MEKMGDYLMHIFVFETLYCWS